jgi:pyroglutamyl-peptidase
MRALVTGFEAFGGARANASYAAVVRLPARIGTLDVVSAQLPTSYARSGAALMREIERAQPAFVLCVGEAGERHELNVERVALNVQDACLADNDGAQPIDIPVVSGAPAAYLSTLPVRAIHDALIAAHLPAILSNTAGTFVCNHVFYTLMHFAATTRTRLSAGFLHVPAWRENVRAENTATALTLEEIVRGIAIALELSAAHPSVPSPSTGEG